MRFRTSQGRLKLEMRVLRQGRDIQILLSGGEAHLGAVALAAPPGTPDNVADDADGEAGDVRVLVVPGHREDQLAMRMARRMARELRRTVCVSAGIHFAHISKEEIAVVEALADILTGRCLAALPGSDAE